MWPTLLWNSHTLGRHWPVVTTCGLDLPSQPQCEQGTWSVKHPIRHCASTHILSYRRYVVPPVSGTQPHAAWNLYVSCGFHVYQARFEVRQAISMVFMIVKGWVRVERWWQQWETVPSPLLKHESKGIRKGSALEGGKATLRSQAFLLHNSRTSPEFGLLVEVLNSLWERFRLGSSSGGSSSGWAQEAVGKCNRCITSLWQRQSRCR